MTGVLIIVIIATLFGTVYLLLRRHSLRLLALYDHALHNQRQRVNPAYELPVYARADLSAKWPGWDGWYVFMVPRDQETPVEAIRVSIMTGLYGLDGIDHYAELQGLSPFEAIEFLVMVQTRDASHLFRRYLPKRTDLAIRREQLLVAVKDWGEIGGEWPSYRIQMRDPTAEIEVSLEYSGQDLLWWADLPHLFTYFAAFGEFQGTVIWRGQEYAISGLGSFEHGFARKPFNFDGLFKPLRLLQKLIPFTLIHYHYNLLVSLNGFHGGMMVAQGAGIDFRNLGGIYFPDGRFRRLTGIMVEYLEMEDLTGHSPTPAVPFPKRWLVRAEAEGGIFEYTATRQAPPALIAAHMIYSDFQYEGVFHEPGGQTHHLVGHGYGEYVRM
ncbi:MAG TPA: hypothetical protein VNP04_11450 [Alphaproteobacteria bacterium]|nr:hypothetical protein [Alphaproteobacteria bacterium]